jgi:hypothetical protein
MTRITSNPYDLDHRFVDFSQIFQMLILVARLKESELFTSLEVTTLSAAMVVPPQAALSYLAKGVAAPIEAPLTSEPGKGIQVFFKNIVITKKRHGRPHVLYLLRPHRTPQLFGRLAHRLGISKTLAAIDATVCH